MKRETKNKKKKRKLKVGKVLLTMFILVYIPSLIYWFYGNTTATDILHLGVIEDSININGLLVRNESLINSPLKGEYIPQVEEGEKVAANSTIATVLDSSSLELLSEINEINKKILAAQKEKDKTKEIFSGDIIKIEKELGQKVTQIAEVVNENRFSDLKNLKYEIDSLIEKKAEITGDDNLDDVYIKSLKDKKNSLTANMNTKLWEETSTHSGIISYIIDGYESILTPDSINQITPEVFENILLEETPEIDLSNRRVEGDKPFAKMINDFQFYIVICVKSNTYAKTDLNSIIQQGKRISVRINDINKQMGCNVVFVSDDFNGKTIIALEADRYINQLTMTRKINIDLIKSSYEGLIVPLKCLRNINTNAMSAEIALLKGDIASIRDVIIIGKNNEYAAIEAKDRSNKGIDLYDTYIINPQNIQDGQVIN